MHLRSHARVSGSRIPPQAVSVMEEGTSKSVDSV